MYRLLIVSTSDDPLSYSLLDKKINNIIQKTDCYLFSILCGGIKNWNLIHNHPSSIFNLSLLWAEHNGVPVLYSFYDNPDDMWKGLFKIADYGIFILGQEGEQEKRIKNLAMKYKMLDENKKGSIITRRS